MQNHETNEPLESQGQAVCEHLGGNRPMTFLRVLGLVLVLVLPGCSLPGPDYRAITQKDIPRPSSISGERPIASEIQDLADHLEWSHADEGQEGAHYLSLIQIGQDALLSRVHLIRSARVSIDIQTFIWAFDDTGNWLLRELIRAAQRGVRVRLLIDQLYLNLGTAETMAKLVSTHNNLQIKVYKPVSNKAINTRATFVKSVLFRFDRTNRRMHNKMLLVDDRIGVTGGRNIQDKYFDYDPFFNFKDRDVLIVGREVASMQDSFNAFWEHPLAMDPLLLRDVQKAFETSRIPRIEGFEKELDKEKFGLINRIANAYSIVASRRNLQWFRVNEVEFVSDAPEKRHLLREDAPPGPTAYLRNELARAEQSILLQSPYLILSRRAERRFKALRREKPDVEVHFSSNSLASADHLHVYAISFKHRKSLVKKLGIQIYEFKPRPKDINAMIPRYAQISPLDSDMLLSEDDLPDAVSREGEENLSIRGPVLSIHAKSVVIDGELSFVGSHNLDPRSANLNSECGLFVRDKAFARALADNIRRDMSAGNSWRVARKEHVPVVSTFSGFMGTLSSWLPFLDFWPFQYTTLYELKPGQEPVSPAHPDFFQRYQDVGQFPEVKMLSAIMKTMLIKSMAGFAAPLM